MNRSHQKAWIVTSSIISALLCVQPLAAQVILDNTLPTPERSLVTGNPNFQIDGGARRGGNLFHSFSQFSIPTGGSAFFNNAADVQNILTRVTGGSISNIDGLIRANGTANLFLLNPNGILFSPSASLNIGGSFVATTADALGFPTGEVFSSDATQPLPSQLLTVNPNAFFFNQLMPQPITVQARFDDRAFAVRTSINGTGLHVPPGQNLMLVGGAILFNSGEPFIPPEGSSYAFDGGWLISPGSNVELGAVGGVGSVGLSTTSWDWQLMIPPQVPRADISFNDSGIATQGTSGSIRLLARNIDFFEGYLRSGIPSDVGSPDTQPGDIELNATGSITLSNSGLMNRLQGQGTLGSVDLTAGDRISFDSFWIDSSVYSTGVGNASDINITTGSLSLTNYSVLQSITSGQGNSGSVNINARDTVSFDDSSIYTVNQSAVGNAGGINIATGSLSFTNGARVTSFTTGQGNSGSVNINARDSVSFTRGSLISYTDGQGNAGSVNINADNTISLNNSSVGSAVFLHGIGNAGGINITTESLSLTNGSVLSSGTSGQGNAGNVTIHARDTVSIDGDRFEEYIDINGRIVSYSYARSGIFTQVFRAVVLQEVSEPVGQGGNVTITTGSLSLSNGGTVNTSTERQGNAGRVTIDARDSVQISGTAPTLPDLRSEVFTSAAPGSVGRGGDVSITTGSLTVFDQGRINTNAQGQGKAGNISIRAIDAVSFDGSEITSTLDSGAVGRGGDIDIEARSLSLLNGAQLSASTSGEGNAGKITVSADTVGLIRGGRVLTTTFTSGRAGDITVKTPNLQLVGATSGLFAETMSAGDAGNLTIQPQGNGQSVRVNLQDGAQISASTSGSGHGGELRITAPESITLTGDGSVIAAETGGSGTGGNLNLQTETLNIQNQAEVTVSSEGIGNAGSLFVEANQIYLDNGGRIRADTSGGGGNINLRSPLILLRNGSNITTDARGSNIPGGNIGIDTQFLVTVPNEDSNISANSRDFRGGNVRIDAVALYGIQPSMTSTPLSDITATGATSALPGTIDVTTAVIDPTAGLVALPTDFVDASGLIVQGCPANEGNSFVITGRGGLPPTPEQQLDDDAEWLDRRRLTVSQQTRTRQDQSNQHSDGSTQRLERRTHTPIVEATHWQISPTGQVMLVANTSSPIVQNSLNQPLACN